MDIKEITNGFKSSKIAVIGDVMLDRYVIGGCTRVSPEAPVPVILANEEVHELGGAANVAANIFSLEGNVHLFGYYGKDSTGEILIQKLDEKGISHTLFSVLETTTSKTRIVVDRHQICRVDKEQIASASEKLEERIADEIFSLNPDIIVASDYAKGTLSRNLFLRINERALREGKRVIVDPKPQNMINYSGAYLITPNTKEGREMSGGENAEEIGRILQKKFNTNILLTRGAEGMTLFEGEQITNFPTQAREVYDVTGAGDTVIASVALALASGASLSQAAFLANHAAGIVVGKAGTATVSGKELGQALSNEYSKIKTLDELKIIKSELDRKRLKGVWTNGCFDLIHVGHVKYLEAARRLGDYLIVGVNSDKSVRQLKGEGRPLTPENERARILAAFESVSYVTVFNEVTSENCLRELRPHVFAKGGDYPVDKLNPSERQAVEKYGGKIAIIPYTEGKSTTEIIKKISNSR